jgi:shikimate dehydrogenase
MIKASVIGWPIGHSRSPLIHGFWLKQHDIIGSYDKLAVAPENLKNFIDTLRHGEHVGTNVTIPHKEATLSFVDEADERAHRVGALNTIWRENGKLLATSTDGPGFMANVTQTLPAFDVATGAATILGAGGSTRALTDELLRRGVDRINIWNRTTSRAEQLAHYFGAKVHAINSQELPEQFKHTKLLVNTTSAGMNGEGALNVPWEHLNQNATVADIVYTPLTTAFLREAEGRGHAIVPGLGMLLHQAVVGFEKWFGVRPEVTPELYNLVAKDIDPDYVS